MESCPNDETLNQFLKGTLETERRSAIAEHVSTCLDCQKWIAGMKPIDFSADKKKGVRISFLFIVVPIVTVLIFAVLIFVFSKKTEQEYQLPAETAPSFVFSERSRLVPNREIRPGQVFPSYRVGDQVSIETNFSQPQHFVLLCIDSAEKLRKVFPDDSLAQMRKNPIPAGRQYIPYADAHFGVPFVEKKGIVFFVVLASAMPIPDEQLAPVISRIEELMKQQKGIGLMSSLDSVLRNASWKHQVLAFEVGN